MKGDGVGPSPFSVLGLRKRSRLALFLDQLRFLRFLLEAVDAAFGIDEFLASGEERVAARANFHADVALVSRARTELIPAGTGHIDFLVLGVDPCFHAEKLIPFRRYELLDYHSIG